MDTSPLALELCEQLSPQVTGTTGQRELGPLCKVMLNNVQDFSGTILSYVNSVVFNFISTSVADKKLSLCTCYFSGIFIAILHN